MGLRRGPRPRALVTTTPRPMPLLKRIDEDDWTVTTRGRTSDNINLDEKFVEIMIATYGGTRIGRQELDGELIAGCRGRAVDAGDDRGGASCARRPRSGRGALTGSWSGSTRRRGWARGRMLAGSWSRARRAGRCSCSTMRAFAGLSPEGWASRVAAAAARWNAGLVVAEANNGGAMVESVLKAADSGLKVRLVHASRGKVRAGRADRAEVRDRHGEAGGEVSGAGGRAARDGRGRRL